MDALRQYAKYLESMRCPLQTTTTTASTTTDSTPTTTTATTAEAPNLEEDTVVLITGGNGIRTEVFLTSTEVYPPLPDCSPPSLPSPRYMHSTVATTGPSPKVVTCGGVYSTHYASCFVLDLEKKHWDKSMMGPLPQPRVSHAAVSMENIGTYLIGASS